MNHLWSVENKPFIEKPVQSFYSFLRQELYSRYQRSHSYRSICAGKQSSLLLNLEHSYRYCSIMVKDLEILEFIDIEKYCLSTALSSMRSMDSSVTGAQLTPEVQQMIKICGEQRFYRARYCIKWRYYLNTFLILIEDISPRFNCALTLQVPQLQVTSIKSANDTMMSIFYMNRNQRRLKNKVKNELNKIILAYNQMHQNFYINFL